ncbi:MAG: HD domain-containing protein [Fibromonadales bacterium]|nr:HD domain-containing protein [Fibromonadales bacterium]
MGTQSINIGIERKNTIELKRLQNAIVFVMANLVESRDKITGGHIERTSRYIKILMEAMVNEGLYWEEMVEWDLDTAVASARLHDIGKISVPDQILNKPSKLTPDEFMKIRNHTTEGKQIIDQMIAQTGNTQFLHHAKLFAEYHHERWDGKGYPHGLKGKEIPLQGRIMAIVDVYDALVSERPYKPSFPHEKAIAIIQKDSGTSFDSQIVEIFLRLFK